MTLAEQKQKKVIVFLKKMSIFLNLSQCSTNSKKFVYAFILDY